MKHTLSMSSTSNVTTVKAEHLQNSVILTLVAVTWNAHTIWNIMTLIQVTVKILRSTFVLLGRHISRWDSGPFPIILRAQQLLSVQATDLLFIPHPHMSLLDSIPLPTVLRLQQLLSVLAKDLFSEPHTLISWLRPGPITGCRPLTTPPAQESTPLPLVHPH